MRNIFPALITVFFLLIIAGNTGCQSGRESPAATDTEFSVRDFTPMKGWNPKETLYLDYTGAIEHGFVIPSQAQGGWFRFEFRMRNTGKQPEAYRYKIYYQNQSYKFPEADPADSSRQHPGAWENFYGSWEQTERTFAPTPVIPNDGEYHLVSDSFRIVGNPRNEEKYFTGGKNTRWKRNLRAGSYGFMLVVTTEENIRDEAVPVYIGDIGRNHENTFVNPWFYFLYGPGRGIPHLLTLVSGDTLRVVARPDLGGGIYINPYNFNAETARRYATNLCSQDSAFYRSAPFEQFIHYIDPTTRMDQIPVIADVLNEDYTIRDYNWNRRFYRKEELISTTAATATRPCETVLSDPVNNKIVIRNPKSEFGKWQKQNVGVITRHGMTYGKWTVKAKLTEMLNRNYMWNGITNAIWLITMDEGPWNYRRTCTRGGYMSSYYGGQQDKRIPQTGYSEIDFEILKTVPYCPLWVLPPVYHYGIDDQYDITRWDVPLPEEVVADNPNVVVACTNWDMACWQPEKFQDGCYPVKYEGQTFWAHRWDRNYRALTQKVPAPDDELFGSEYYYFQIDWQPHCIIWRIGPSREKLRVVGYMDHTVTSIPNNQMKLIVTQEFHNTRWWIGSAYLQENVPFPARDLEGEIYEVTIE